MVRVHEGSDPKKSWKSIEVSNTLQTFGGSQGNLYFKLVVIVRLGLVSKFEPIDDYETVPFKNSLLDANSNARATYLLHSLIQMVGEKLPGSLTARGDRNIDHWQMY